MTSTATPQADTSALTWQLVHAEPGALVYAAAGLNPTHPLVRHAASRTTGWVPAGTLTTHAEPEQHSALHYAEYIGRVGVLAAALGVGAALAGQQPGIAWAQDTDTDAGSSSSSTSADAGTEASEPSGSTTISTSSDSDSGGAQTSETAPDAGAETSTDSPSETSTTVAAPGSTGPTATVSSSGGATSTPSDQEFVPEEPTAPTETATAPVEQTPVEETPPAQPVAEPAQAAPAPETTPLAPSVATPQTSGSATTPTGARQGAASETVAITSPTTTPSTAMLQAPLSPTTSPTTAPTNGATSPTTATPAAAAPTTLQASATTATPAPGGLISRFVTMVLAPFSPAATTPAAQAAQTPVLWGLFAWIRRTYFNSTPTVSYDPTGTTQVDDTITGHLTGLDPDGDTLTYTATAPTNGGTVTFAPGGAFTYTVPDSMYATGGTDTFTVTATDAGAAHIHGLSGFMNMITFGIMGNPGHTATTTVTLTIAAVNAAPVPGTPAYTLEPVDHSSGAVPGAVHVTDPDDDILAYSYDVSGGPTDGRLDLNDATGTFTYTPNPDARHDAAGTPIIDLDHFAVTVNDGHGGVISVPVSVAIDPINQPPTITGLTISDPSGATGAVNVTITVTDPDTDPIVYLVVHDPSNGTVAPSPGGVIYTPTEEARKAAAYTQGADFDTFQIEASDLHGGVTVPQSVTVEISPANIAPDAANDTATTLEDTPVSGNVLANDTDFEHATLTVFSHTQPQHGDLSIAPDGTFTYTPNRNFNGADSFTYTASDGVNTSNTATVAITVTAVNDAPVAVSDAYTTLEDVPVSGNVLNNDVDVEGTPLTATLGTGPAHGNLVLSADGSFTYTPDQNWSGADGFSYTASDGTNTSNSAAVAITVVAVNDAPVAVNDLVTTAEDTPVTGNVLTNDTDVEGTTLTAALVGGPAHGALNLAPNGAFTYTPNQNFNGADSFTYTASDGAKTSNPATVAITVSPVNDAPVAANDTVTTLEDTPVSGNVLANDTDVEGTTLTAALVGGPAHGTLNLAANGSFTYAPAPNYNGADSFTYKASDGTLTSNTATVAITVTAVNDAPVAVDDAFSTAEDTAVSGNVLTNDGDVEGTTLTAVLVGNPSHGTVNLATNGTFTYTPAVNYNGADSFTYRATDGSLTSNTATVAITVTQVNDVPVAVNDTVSVAKNTPATGNVLTNDTDAEGTTLTAALVSNPTHGTVTLAGNGLFTYTPATDYTGADSFSYTASDGVNTSNTATVTVNVGVINTAPVAANDSYTTLEDNPVSGNVLTNDTDAEHDTLTATLVTGPAHGTVNLAANGTFTYTPAANYNGPDTFTYRASDGALTSNVATVGISVTAVNDAPVAVDDAFTTDEDTAVTGNVLTNDGDVEGTTLTAILVGNPSHGTVNLATTGSFTYTPAANYNGADSFTYRASDGSLTSNVATVAITITPVNDAPIALGDSVTTAEDTAATGNVLTNDTDVDTAHAALTAALVTGPSHGTVNLATDGSFTYTPAANYNGADSFTYRASDGSLPSSVATVAITITPVNDAPIALGDSFTTAEDTAATGNVLTNDTDVDTPHAALTATLVGNASHGTVSLNTDGSFTYTPALNYNGPDSFTYSASDSSLTSNVATVAITITPVNDAPIALGDSVTTAEDTAATGNVLTNDTDVDTAHAALTAALVTGPSHGTVNLATDGSFTYTPAANYNGADSFTYRASDGSLPSSVATVAITITPVNDAPIALGDSFTTAEDTAATGNVLTNDTDVDTPHAALTATLVGNASHGTVSLNTDGSFTYTPALNYNGPDSFTYSASDASLTSNVATVAITITPVNDAPVVNTVTVDAADATTGAVTVSVSASDPDGDPVTLTSSTPPKGAVSIVDNLNGTWTLSYRPTEASRLQAALTSGADIDSFTVTASDTHSETTTAPVNAVPVAPGYFAVTASADTVTGPMLVVGDFGYIASSYGGVVVVIDTDTLAPIGQPIPVGSAPVWMATSGNNLYVSLFGDNKVSVIDTTNNTFVTNIDVGHSPYGLAASGNKLYVTNTGWDTLPGTSTVNGTVSVIDTDPTHTLTYNTVIDTITVGKGPFNVVASTDGSHVYVDNTNDNTVSVIQTSDNSVVGLPITVGTAPAGMAVAGHSLYVANSADGTVTVIDTDTNTVVDGPITVGNLPATVIASPDGSLVFVANNSDKTVTVIDTSTNTVIDTNPGLAGVQPLSFENPPYYMVTDGTQLGVSTTAVGATSSTFTRFDITGNGSPAVGFPAYTLDAPDPVDGSIHGQGFLADPNGDQLQLVEIIQGTRNGNVVGDPFTGTFTYTPELAARIRAGTGGENAEHIAITVSDGVNPPVTVRVDIPISPTDVTVSDPILAGDNNAMVVSPDGTRAYLANNAGTVVVVDATRNPVGDPIPVGSNPSALALSGNLLYVTNSGSDNVTVIDINNDTNSVVGTVIVGDDPQGVAVSEYSGLAYVSNRGSDTVSVIGFDWETNTYKVIETISTGIEDQPWGVAASADGGRYVYVANSWGNSISVIDADPSHESTFNTVITWFRGADIAGPISLATSSHDGRNWLNVANVNGGITQFDTDTNTQIGAPTFLPDGVRPYNVVVSTDGSIVYASVPSDSSGLTNQVYAIDARYRDLLDTDFDNAGVQPLTVGATAGSAPQGMAFNPVTNELYVLNKNEGTISTASMTTLGQPPLVASLLPPSEPDPTTGAVSGSLAAAPTAARTTSAISQPDNTVGVGNHPTEVAVSPDGTRAYVTNADSKSVSVIDTATNTVVATVGVGNHPTAVTVSPDGTRAYVTNSASKSVSVIDTKTNAVLATIGVGKKPTAVTVSPDGARAYVTNTDSRSVSVIDTHDQHGAGHRGGRRPPHRGGRQPQRHPGLRHQRLRQVGVGDRHPHQHRARHRGRGQPAHRGGPQPRRQPGLRQQLLQQVGVGDRHRHQHRARHRRRGRSPHRSSGQLRRRPGLRHQHRRQVGVGDRHRHRHGARDRGRRQKAHRGGGQPRRHPRLCHQHQQQDGVGDRHHHQHRDRHHRRRQRPDRAGDQRRQRDRTHRHPALPAQPTRSHHRRRHRLPGCGRPRR